MNKLKNYKTFDVYNVRDSINFILRLDIESLKKKMKEKKKNNVRYCPQRKVWIENVTFDSNDDISNTTMYGLDTQTYITAHI